MMAVTTTVKIHASPSGLGYKSAAEMETIIATTLDTAVVDGTFSKLLEAACGQTVVVLSVVTSEDYSTPSPTLPSIETPVLLPIGAPTFSPSTSKNYGGSESSEMSVNAGNAGIFGGIAACTVAFIVCAFALGRYFGNKSRGNHDVIVAEMVEMVDLEHVSSLEAEMSQQNTHGHQQNTRALCNEIEVRREKNSQVPVAAAVAEGIVEEMRSPWTLQDDVKEKYYESLPCTHI